jgi:nitroimidazol reductase NimA-like FMN-containing flavoprotein (pyridoxamine 5'-phosphate oxidase superfamily)
MTDYPADHTGLEVLPLTECLRLLASVPVGRIAFHAAGEVIVLPVNHLVDGQDIVFRTAAGSKLSAAEQADIVAFEADDYDAQARTGWSVVVNGQAEILYENTQTQRLSGLGLDSWATDVDRPFWIRIRPTSVSGRRIPQHSSG